MGNFDELKNIKTFILRKSVNYYIFYTRITIAITIIIAQSSEPLNLFLDQFNLFCAQFSKSSNTICVKFLFVYRTWGYQKLV